MNCFQLVKSVLDELYGRVPGTSDEEKDTLIRKQLTNLSTSYAQLKTKNTVDHSNLASRLRTYIGTLRHTRTSSTRSSGIHRSFSNYLIARK